MVTTVNYIIGKSARILSLLALCGAVAACSGPRQDMATMDSRAAFDAHGYVKPMRVSSKAIVAPSLAYEFASAVPTTLRFEPGQRGISNAHGGAIRAQAAFMRANPSAVFTIFGHADASEGDAAVTDQLGKGRAMALKTALIDLGANPSQIRIAPTLGAREPASFDESNAALNRRTVTELTGTL